MKKFYMLLTACAFVMRLSAQPITLTNANMPGNGDTLRYSNAQLSSIGNYTQTGANFNWDFSTLTFAGQGVRQFKSGLLTPYALLFLSLNEYGEKLADTLGAGPLTITNYYNFYKKQSSPAAYIADGAGMTFSSIPLPNYYTDKDELYNFPMSYPKYDSTTFKFSTPSNSIIPIIYTKSGYRVTVVDGWGTITTPYGTASCLRLVTTQYSNDSIKNTFFPIPFGFPDYQRSYQWLTAASKIPYLEVSGNLTGTVFTPTQVRYRDSYRAPGTVTNTYTAVQQQKDLAQWMVYPNPVTEYLQLSGDINMHSAELFDLAGARLNMPEPVLREGRWLLNVSGLNRGVYFF